MDPELAVDATDEVLDVPRSPETSLLRFFFRNSHFVWAQGRLFALSIGILCISAYSALHRPYSAAPAEPDASDKPQNKKRRRRDTTVPKQSIDVSEAVMMPFIAGTLLVGLYYLMQYLQDPLLIIRIFRVYTSVFGLYSTGKLLGDLLDLLASLLFPNVWATPAASSTGRPRLFHVDAAHRCQMCEPPAPDGDWSPDPRRASPFPDRLAWLAPTPAAARRAWAVRRLLREDWTMRATVYGVGNVRLRATLGTLVGVLLSAGLTTVYFFFPAFSYNLLTNVQGLGFCYSGLLIVSCTTFGIGTLLLSLLFVYDVIMVFYTPFMVAVATGIDAPIKLVATTGTGEHAKSSMLGLGDIVVPGIFVCMCLRYDLYRFYARQIRQVPTKLETEVLTGSETATLTKTATRSVKAPYIDPQGRWGDRLWTLGLFGLLFSRAAPPTPGLRAAAFPKPLFRVGVLSYIVGLFMAFLAVMVTGRGQPALFYLVPTILLSTWGWAWQAGELREMWSYTEDPSADVKDVVVEVGPDGKPVEQKKEEEEEADAQEDGEVLVVSVKAPTDEDVAAVVY